LKNATSVTNYAGLYTAIFFAQNHQMVALEIVPAKVDMLNRYLFWRDA
jgi:UDPglucose 6-dehydrogenase